MAPVRAKWQKQLLLSSDFASSDFARALSLRSLAFGTTPKTLAATAAAAFASPSPTPGIKGSLIIDNELEQPLIQRPPLKQSKKQNNLFTYGYKMNIKGLDSQQYKVCEAINESGHMPPIKPSFCAIRARQVWYAASAVRGGRRAAALSGAHGL